MLTGGDRKPERREDAIYNPIEDKWERRSTTTSIKYYTQDEDSQELQLKKWGQSILKKAEELVENPIDKISKIKTKQDSHDRKFFSGTDEDYSKAKKAENATVIQVIIAVIIMILAAISRF